MAGLGPFAVAEVGARFVVGQAEGGEDGVGHGNSCNCAPRCFVLSVVPAEAGTQCARARLRGGRSRWVPACAGMTKPGLEGRSEEHTSELQSLMRISYAVFCLKKIKYIRLYTSRPFDAYMRS